MTPDKARALLDGTTPGPWGYCSPRGKDGHYDPVFGDVPGDEIALVKRPADWHLIAAAPTLAAMRAEMREEWGVEYAGVNHGRRHTEWGYETRDEAERQARRYRLCTDMHPVGIVRRYVTTEEEA